MSDVRIFSSEGTEPEPGSANELLRKRYGAEIEPMANGQRVDIVSSMRVADTDECVPGSTRKACADCREPVWCSPASAGVLRDNPRAVIVCTRCTLRRADAAIRDREKRR